MSKLIDNKDLSVSLSGVKKYVDKGIEDVDQLRSIVNTNTEDIEKLNKAIKDSGKFKYLNFDLPIYDEDSNQWYIECVLPEDYDGNIDDYFDDDCLVFLLSDRNQPIPVKFSEEIYVNQFLNLGSKKVIFLNKGDISEQDEDYLTLSFDNENVSVTDIDTILDLFNCDIIKGYPMIEADPSHSEDLRIYVTNDPEDVRNILNKHAETGRPLYLKLNNSYILITSYGTEICVNNFINYGEDSGIVYLRNGIFRGTAYEGYFSFDRYESIILNSKYPDRLGESLSESATTGIIYATLFYNGNGSYTKDNPKYDIRINRIGVREGIPTLKDIEDYILGKTQIIINVDNKFILYTTVAEVENSPFLHFSGVMRYNDYFPGSVGSYDFCFTQEEGDSYVWLACVGAKEIDFDNLKYIFDNGESGQVLIQTLDGPEWRNIDDSLTDYATKADLTQAKSDVKDELIGTAPGTYDTLGEIAEYIEEHGEAAAAMAESIASKADKSELSGYVKKTGDTITGRMYFSNDSLTQPFISIVNPKDREDALAFNFSRRGTFGFGIGYNSKNNIILGSTSTSDSSTMGETWLTVANSTTTANRFAATASEGTSPFSVNSTTVVNNLNADFLDGAHAGFNNGNVAKFISFPAYTTFTDAGEYTGIGTEDYCKSLCKWLQKNYPNDSNFIGQMAPNSSGFAWINKYRNTDTGEDGLPRYCTGYYISLGGNKVAFGTNNYNWFFIKEDRGKTLQLQNPRTIWGQSFDGSSDVSGNLSNVGTISANNNITITKDTECGLYLYGKDYTASFKIGSGGVNRGVYDETNKNWILYRDDTLNVLIPNGNIGIGTHTPTAKLHVNGTSYLGGETRIVAPYVFLKNKDITKGYYFGINDDGSLGIHQHDNYSWFKDVLYLSPYGSVGIGTTSPGSQLEVVGYTTLRGSVSIIGTLSYNKRVYKASTSGQININPSYDIAEITLNGNVTTIIPNAIPSVGHDITIILLGNGVERTVVIDKAAIGIRDPNDFAGTTMIGVKKVFNTGENSIELTVPKDGYAEVNMLYNGDGTFYVRAV